MKLFCFLSTCIAVCALTAPGSVRGDDLPESWVNPPPAGGASGWTPEKESYRAPIQAPLVSMGPDGKLAYNPYTSRGDRILDFSHCGYQHSEEPIPAVPAVITLTPPDGPMTTNQNMAYATGPDSFETIQEALNKVAALEPDADGFRGAVLLKKGTWYVSDGLLVRSGVVLRGEGDGEDGTELIFTMPQGNGVGIQLGEGGGTASSVPVWITGTVSEGILDNGNNGYFLTLDDGFTFHMRTPRARFGWELDDWVGRRACFKFIANEKTQGMKRTVRLDKTFPWEVKKIDKNDAGPALDPDLILPGQEEEEEVSFEPFRSGIADDYVPSGSKRLTLEDASGFAAGDTVNVAKTTNERWIEVLGVGERLRHIRGGREGAGKHGWSPGQFNHYRRITNVSSNTINLNVNLPQSIERRHGGGTVQKIPPPDKSSQCGVEYLRIVSNYDKFQTSNSKSANYANLKNGIGMKCRNGWVRNCTVFHVWYAAVSIGGSQYCTVRDCASLQPVGPVRGGKRYTFNIGSSHGILVYNCSSEDGRHDFVVGARTCGPNAFVKCSVPEGGNGEPHHRWGNGTLWDNVSMPNGGVLASFNRGDSGSGHGWAGANSVFWNCNAENIVVFDPETEGENNFAIGYTGTVTNEYPAGGLYYANTRAGYWDTPQEGEYYGYAAMGSGYIESPDGPVKPDSLFKQQLIDRIGRETAVQVLSPGERPTAVEPYNEQKTSREAESNVLFEDPMDGDWQKNWFLDGKKTLLMNLDGGLYFSAGSVTKYDDKVEYNAHHAVLWTQQEFDGDIRVSFETKQVDQSDYGNVLIYLQAQGIGTPPYEEDISGWSELREIPAMNKYFTYMDLLSLSLRKELRLRRYPLRSMDGSEKFSSLIEPMEDWHGMTRDKWFRFVIEKRKESYTFKSYDAETGELLEEFTWDTSGQGGKRDLPFVEKGRIGLRHMSTKKSIYKNFKVERL